MVWTRWHHRAIEPSSHRHHRHHRRLLALQANAWRFVHARAHNVTSIGSFAFDTSHSHRGSFGHGRKRKKNAPDIWNGVFERRQAQHEKMLSACHRWLLYNNEFNAKYLHDVTCIRQKMRSLWRLNPILVSLEGVHASWYAQHRITAT